MQFAIPVLQTEEERKITVTALHLAHEGNVHVAEMIKSMKQQYYHDYHDNTLEERDKISYLRLAKDCNKVIEEMDNFLRQKNYHGSGSRST